MLEALDQVPWAEIEHAYGPAADVPDLLRQLLDHDPRVRSETLHSLYGNVFHQGTRFPAACSEIAEPHIDLPGWCRSGKIG
jgi:hypothetical protein